MIDAAEATFTAAQNTAADTLNRIGIVSPRALAGNTTGACRVGNTFFDRESSRCIAIRRQPKSPVIFRPATEADFIALFGKPPQHRARALAAEIDGRLVGLGGFALVTPGETQNSHHACEFWVCFMRAGDELRARPVALHRAGLRMIAEAQRLGIRRLVALAEPGIEAAERWLRRFDFVPEEINGEIVFVRNTERLEHG